MIEFITAAVSLCKSALTALKWTKEQYDAKSFSDEQNDILRAAAEDGVIQIVMVSSLLAVFAGGTMFEGRDPARRARYLDAFIELCDKGLIVYHDEEMFSLNGKGFEIARSLPPWVQPDVDVDD